MRKRLSASGPWILAVLALVYTWWPGSLERYGVAIAYDDLRHGVREAAYIAERVSEGVADPAEAAFLRGRVNLFLYEAALRSYPFSVFRRADRLFAWQWQEWEQGYTLVWFALEKRVGSDPGPIPAPSPEEARLYRQIARELRLLAEELDQPWEPVSGAALYRRRPGAYLNGRLRFRIKPHLDALGEQSFRVVAHGYPPSQPAGEGARHP